MVRVEIMSGGSKGVGRTQGGCSEWAIKGDRVLDGTGTRRSRNPDESSWSRMQNQSWRKIIARLARPRCGREERVGIRMRMAHIVHVASEDSGERGGRRR